jgi:hypothetical protein
MWMACAVLGCATSGVAQSSMPKELAEARQAMVAKQFVHAKELFRAYGLAHPGSVDAELGVADAELGLHEYEAAEMELRRVTAQQPELWVAHKNLVVIEAALGRWEDFDNERTVLRLARQRGAPGITARESDVIDSFDILGNHWIVREYYEPVGRSLTRYNFERFSADGKVREYVSLESANAAQKALDRGDVRIGEDQQTAPAIKDFALNFYTGKAHGMIKLYPQGEPKYERVRADVMRWLRTH